MPFGNRSPEQIEEARHAFIEDQLERLSRGWTVQEVFRSYKANRPGEEEFARDNVILRSHGYEPDKTSGGGRLFVTFRRVDGQQEPAPARKAGAREG